MNIQARIDYLTEMLESAKYEANVNVNPARIAYEFSDLVRNLEEAIATLEHIKELKAK
ncbi:hypothetical protein PMW_41 [Pseudomonas phage phiPMW]|uniref:Uncharacterized protein n=1 Tax=Pseudomonas phage phiPMW TaxID=1815582 RepID=A0A1S5R182_9CAUD|nr:hypothetical protein FDG97_gp041 [Pseudomonas phage phiPMW]ANA49166.1 hypothetical protein PMW_41 [Pseudomonas phage phiPMW]